MRNNIENVFDCLMLSPRYHLNDVPHIEPQSCISRDLICGEAHSFATSEDRLDLLCIPPLNQNTLVALPREKVLVTPTPP